MGKNISKWVWEWSDKSSQKCRKWTNWGSRVKLQNFFVDSEVIFEIWDEHFSTKKISSFYDTLEIWQFLRFKWKFWLNGHKYCQFFFLVPFFWLGANYFFQIFELGLIAVQNEFWNFWALPYSGAKLLFKFSGLALLRCKTTFQIFGLGLIAVHQCTDLTFYALLNLPFVDVIKVLPQLQQSQLHSPCALVL